MQLLVALVVALVGCTINFGWDLTFRRREARRLTQARRRARPRGLPPALDEEARQRLLPDDEVRAFVEHTRATFVELDSLIDRFDLLRLRARDRGRFGVVFVNAEEPRSRACELLEQWLRVESTLDQETRASLVCVGLGPVTIAEVVGREHERAGWEFRADTAEVLDATITDLDRAVIHLQGIVRTLERDAEDPYR